MRDLYIGPYRKLNGGMAREVRVRGGSLIGFITETEGRGTGIWRFRKVGWKLWSTQYTRGRMKAAEALWSCNAL